MATLNHDLKKEVSNTLNAAGYLTQETDRGLNVREIEFNLLTRLGFTVPLLHVETPYGEVLAQAGFSADEIAVTLAMLVSIVEQERSDIMSELRKGQMERGVFIPLLHTLKVYFLKNGRLPQYIEVDSEEVNLDDIIRFDYKVGESGVFRKGQHLTSFWGMAWQYIGMDRVLGPERHPELAEHYEIKGAEFTLTD